MRYSSSVHIVFLFLCSVGISCSLFSGRYSFALVLIVLAAIFLWSYLVQRARILKRLQEYVQAVFYRDFTRRYPEKRTSSRMEREMNQAFNQLNEVYMQVSTEKELQHQYLKKVINMLDAAMLFYHAPSGRVEWINDAFKALFQTPHLGNIKGLQKRNKELYAITQKLKVGSQQVETAGSFQGSIKLLIQMSAFQTQGGEYRVVVYQNISEAIDATENKAWQKLLRVLTHEIMNSIAPISSLAQTLQTRLTELPGQQGLAEITLGVDTIQRRSEGLLKFAKSYRMIGQVDQPQFADWPVALLFENVCQLLEPSFQQKGIEVDIILKNTRLMVTADASLVEQVLINLILNAIQAVGQVPQPYISLSAIQQQDRVLIKLSDNGTGIPKELLEQVFTPFFTTKKSGSGIGLTLSKQIMLVHQGSISVESQAGKGTTFTLIF